MGKVKILQVQVKIKKFAKSLDVVLIHNKVFIPNTDIIMSINFDIHFSWVFSLINNFVFNCTISLLNMTKEDYLKIIERSWKCHVFALLITNLLLNIVQFTKDIEETIFFRQFKCSNYTSIGNGWCHDSEMTSLYVYFSVSGCTDYFTGTEQEAISISRDVVSAFNVNPPESPQNYDEPLYDPEEITGIIPNKDQHTMDMYQVSLKHKYTVCGLYLNYLNEDNCTK